MDRTPAAHAPHPVVGRPVASLSEPAACAPDAEAAWTAYLLKQAQIEGATTLLIDALKEALALGYDDRLAFHVTVARISGRSDRWKEVNDLCEKLAAARK